MSSHLGPKRFKLKGRKAFPTFIALAKEWLKSPQWAALNPYELKLVLDLAAQYNGSNNGDLCAAWSKMRERGWRSPSTLNRAIKGAQAKGWLDCSRAGGRHVASLYALTFWGINACGGKLDIGSNPVPSHRWKNSLGSPDVNQSSRVPYQFTPALVKKAA